MLAVAEDEMTNADLDIELVTFAVLELELIAPAKLDRDEEEAEELIDTDFEAEDEVEVDAGADDDRVTIVPLTFLGIANALPSFVDRYKAILFH